MAKLTVNQMIDRLTPDRQEAVLAKAERITKARETVKFESVGDVLGRVPVDRRVKIEKYADSPALAMEAARLKGKDVASFSRHLRAVGAKLVAKMPGGREVDLRL